MKLSILLPSYNNKCLSLVQELQQQASVIDSLEYEIIVADDGGTDFDVKRHNSAINDLTHCRYIIRQANVGRAAIRNFLASLAQYDWLLFLDSDVCIGTDDYILSYMNEIRRNDGLQVIYGGVSMIEDDKAFGHLLRYRYEHAEAHNHTAARRLTRPYACFRTTNFLIRRDVFEEIRFDERFVNYGYEDVMFGKKLRDKGYHIHHIDNQLVYTDFENNAAYLRKIEDAMRTLHFFQLELKGFSPILSYENKIRLLHMNWAVRLFHWIFYPIIKVNLLSRHPSLTAFKLYKLGYFATIHQQ